MSGHDAEGPPDCPRGGEVTQETIMPTATAPKTCKTYSLVGRKTTVEFVVLNEYTVQVTDYIDRGNGRGWSLCGIPQRLPKWKARELYSDLRRRGYTPF
jgi:hypothetical protein